MEEPAEPKKRDNHYVPKMYLRQWSNNGNTVWTYDTVVRNERQRLWRSRGVGGLSHWKDFYSQINDDGSIDDSIERLFGEYEQRTGTALRRLREGVALGPDDRAALVDFAILQMVRTPAWYQKTALLASSQFATASRNTLDKLENDLRLGIPLSDAKAWNNAEEARGSAIGGAPFPQWDIDVEIDEVASEITLSMGVGRKSYLAGLGSILNGSVGNAMRGYDWSIIEMPEGELLPTCDNPFVRLGEGQDGQLRLDAGVGESLADLFMPLTPRHLLFTEVGGARLDPERIVSEPKLLRLIKDSIVMNAMRYVYDSKKSDWIVELRPRRVDPERHRQMADATEHWNEMQA